MGVNVSIDYNARFSELKREVKDEGLLNRRPGWAIYQGSLIVIATILGFYFVDKIHPIFSVILFASILTRCGFFTHDLLHFQYFDRKASRRLAYFFGNIFTGMSSNWWEMYHNYGHHTFPNCADKDADAQTMGGAFIDDKKWPKWFMKYQHIYFWVLPSALWVNFIIEGWRWTIPRKMWGEWILMQLHWGFPIYMFMTLPTVDAWIVVAGSYALFGTWLSFGFATNHIGCVYYEGESYKDVTWFELQMVTARNLRGGIFVHCLFGGLNTQTEHHLFPTSPRANLLRVSEITKAYCEKHNLPFFETGVFESYVQIHKALKENRPK